MVLLTADFVIATHVRGNEGKEFGTVPLHANQRCEHVRGKITVFPRGLFCVSVLVSAIDGGNKATPFSRPGEQDFLFRFSEFTKVIFCVFIKNNLPSIINSKNILPIFSVHLKTE